ncbi:tyrosine-type recombinase/integrase [Candidatus Poriferisocius sp.]|uniref:tyrosine-type recombinase/integrase n=1 Tax=Candidatus Poriferisocius sp. TaxID=3101276 RepID=UPI003B017FD7
MNGEKDPTNDPVRPQNGVSARATSRPKSGPDPEELELLIAHAKEAAIAENTRKTYRTGWNSWAHWASERGHSTLPADPWHLQGWLATLFRDGKRPTTLQTYLAAVSYVHREIAGHNPAHDPEVRVLLSGLSQMAVADGVTPKQAAPLRWDCICAILKSAYIPRNNQPGGRLETPQQAQQRAKIGIAMVTVAHNAALRCWELLALTWDDIKLSEDRECATVWIRRSKTDQTGKGAAAPISAIAYQALIRIKPPNAQPGDRIFNFSASTLNRRIKAAAEAAGLDPANISSHSLRVGLAQDLTAKGTPTHGLMLAGRWTSQTTPTHYTRRLAAQHTPAAQYLKTLQSPEAETDPEQQAFPASAAWGAAAQDQGVADSGDDGKHEPLHGIGQMRTLS